jgi:hypothetical protein
MRFPGVALSVLVLATSSSIAQESRQAAIDKAIEAAKQVCLVGSRFKFNLDTSGKFTITKVLPGGELKATIDSANATGGVLFEREEIRQLVDADIRKCMADQWPRILNALEGKASRSQSMQKFLTDFERDTTVEKVREMLGAPSGRKNITFKRRTYSLERYESEHAEIYLIGSNPFRGVAMHLTGENTPTGVIPIPYYPRFLDGGDKGLGELTLSDLKSCRGKLLKPDARWVYVKVPACFYGAAAGSNQFVFSFLAGEALDTCKLGPWDIENKQFDRIDCPHFWQARPNFALVYLSDDPVAEEAMADAVLRYAYWRE